MSASFRSAPNPPLSSGMVEEVERELGVRLPPTYVALMRVHNGGALDAYCPVHGEVPRRFARLVEDRLVRVGRIAGIVPGRTEPSSIARSTHVTRERELPEGLVLLDGDGHFWIALDVRVERREPPVVLVAAGEDATLVLAPAFAAFWGALRDADEIVERGARRTLRERSELVAIERELSLVLAAVLADLRPRFAGTTVRAVALDLHPWHPVLELSILTLDDWKDDSLLLDPSEQAAWPHFHATDPGAAGRGLSRHPVAAALAERWSAHRSDTTERARVFACARAALEGEAVSRELASWSVHEELALFAIDPDASGNAAP